MRGNKPPLDYELDLDLTTAYRREEDRIVEVKKAPRASELILLMSIVFCLVFGAACIYEHTLKRDPAICFSSQNTCP